MITVAILFVVLTGSAGANTPPNLIDPTYQRLYWNLAMYPTPPWLSLGGGSITIDFNGATGYVHSAICKIVIVINPTVKTKRPDTTFGGLLDSVVNHGFTCFSLDFSYLDFHPDNICSWSGMHKRVVGM